MPRFTVRLDAKMYVRQTQNVIANTPEEAEAIALDQCGDCEWKPHSLFEETPEVYEVTED
jgi:hypothetical protein